MISETAASNRRLWLQDITRFMQHRSIFTSHWGNLSNGKLEAFKCTCDSDFNISRSMSNRRSSSVALDSAISSIKINMRLRQESVRGLKDLFDKAIVAKRAFDEFLIVVIAKFKSESVGSFTEKSGDFINDIRIREQLSSGSSSDWQWWIDTSVKEKSTGALITSSLKVAARVISKCKENYSDCNPGPPQAYICDIVRASIVCVNERQLLSLLQLFSVLPETVYVKNRFRLPAANGYRDVLLYLKMKCEDINGKSFNFICELQLHHMEMLKLSLQYSSLSYYEKYRTYFGVSANIEAGLAARLKVLKKMDQIGDDVATLESFMEPYMSGQGRISRDLNQLDIFFDLFVRSSKFSSVLP